MVEAEESAAPRKAVLAAATAAKRATTTKSVAPPAKKAAPAKKAVKAVESPAEAKAPAKKTAKKATGAAAAKDAGKAASNGAAPADAEDETVALVDGEPVEPTPEVLETDSFTLTDDEEDAPAQQVATAGATADPVKDYLKQIGKVALLNAEQEVELAKRIEAGLFAEEKLNSGEKFAPKMKKELDWIAEDGRRAKNHLLEANLRLVVSWPSATPVAACSSSISSRRATSV